MYENLLPSFCHLTVELFIGGFVPENIVGIIFEGFCNLTDYLTDLWFNAIIFVEIGLQHFYQYPIHTLQL